MKRILLPSVVSAHTDADGNYRAINPDAPGFVGYGRTPEETDENLRRNVATGERANPLALAEAMFMALSPADQARFIDDQAKLRHP